MKEALARTHHLGRVLFSFSPPFFTLQGRGKAKPPSPLSGLAAMLTIARGLKK
jgi:hypothetical protein